MHRVFVIVLYERLPTFCYTCGMVGHGTNACSRRLTTGNAGVTPLPCSLQGSAVDSGCSLDDGNEISGPVPPLPRPDPPGHENTPSSPPLMPDSEFGPWLLVSRRRGLQCGHGGSVRASHMAAGSSAKEMSGPRVT